MNKLSFIALLALLTQPAAAQHQGRERFPGGAPGGERGGQHNGGGERAVPRREPRQEPPRRQDPPQRQDPPRRQEPPQRNEPRNDPRGGWNGGDRDRGHGRDDNRGGDHGNRGGGVVITPPRRDPWPGGDHRIPDHRGPVIVQPRRPEHRPTVIVRPDPRGGRAIPRPDRFHEPSRVLDPRRDHWRTWNPGYFPDGRAIWQRPIVGFPRREHVTVITDSVILGNVVIWNRTEIVSGRPYWHDHNGTRICHIYDGGVHWYGIYVGDSYYWSRWHEDRWWWYDSPRGRWCYWRDGRWWWQDPARVESVYVYVPERDAYDRYDEVRGGVVTRPETPTTGEKESYTSSDGARTVQIYGESRDAFLYDTDETVNFEPKYLASNVKEVRFSENDGTPLQILVLTDANGVSSFKVFDRDGFSLTAADAVPQDAPPPASEPRW